LRDLAGLIEHAARLGASCLWLMPFYPTPNRDDCYDITDYLAVDRRLGDLGRRRRRPAVACAPAHRAKRQRNEIVVVRKESPTLDLEQDGRPCA
jgi:hypothetical protein